MKPDLSRISNEELKLLKQEHKEAKKTADEYSLLQDLFNNKTAYAESLEKDRDQHLLNAQSWFHSLEGAKKEQNQHFSTAQSTKQSVNRVRK